MCNTESLQISGKFGHRALTGKCVTLAAEMEQISTSELKIAAAAFTDGSDNTASLTRGTSLCPLELTPLKHSRLLSSHRRKHRVRFTYESIRHWSARTLKQDSLDTSIH